MSLLDQLPIWLTNHHLVPVVVGFLACFVALLIGWRLVGSRSASKPQEASEMKFVEGLRPERRSAPRRKGNTVEVLLSMDDQSPPMCGWVIDRSQGGLCILSDQPIAELTVLRVRPRVGVEQLPWTEVTIRYCREHGHQFELGCQFHRTPTYNVMLQFG
ncbi:MAG: PilZ domain-containing protein [Planctomycetia bacterium]|nr:PilZ domain-containing protein [Planctomycetia bacterium]